MITPCTSIEQPGWLALRRTLWPEGTDDEHLAEMAEFIGEPQRFAQFIACTDQGEPIGFIELALRHDYVNGTESSPVAFLEGIYVAPAHRGRGTARDLVAAAMAWARQHRCIELASDAPLDNEASQAMHRSLGFEETERVVYFRKRLAAQQ
ncbi:aminoglycoside 6'-N-acetyltransferase [Pelomonas sp. KK5]|uniref:aminoglycoside 6'-N-acetyltransferase n=1 Tax=Pelomonas sp. KK5 TaxID=1855730 RepID=UPI00097C988D|nr:aminoglycoside 6'-N-acetyltransferase [Pelomonas sp. KK5]